jgi:hypothetical protein
MEYETGAASLFATAARTPDFCLALLLSTSDRKTAEVIAIKFGEMGYCKTDHGRQTREWVDGQNERMGIDKATAMAFEMCSLFGRWWHYEEIKHKMEERMPKPFVSDVANVRKGKVEDAG